MCVCGTLPAGDRTCGLRVTEALVCFKPKAGTRNLTRTNTRTGTEYLKLGRAPKVRQREEPQRAGTRKLTLRQASPDMCLSVGHGRRRSRTTAPRLTTPFPSPVQRQLSVCGLQQGAESPLCSTGCLASCKRPQGTLPTLPPTRGHGFATHRAVHAEMALTLSSSASLGNHPPGP